MIVAARRTTLAAALLLVLASCGTTTPSVSPSQAATTPAPSTAASAPPASAPPTAPPSAPPIGAPTATAVPSQAACQELPQTGVLPSDRFVGLNVAKGADADRVTFVFGDGSLGGPGGTPQGSLTVARKPYTEAGSGAPISMDGEHVVQVRFTGMSLSNDVGQPTYDGPAKVEPDFDALRKAVLFDASEGVIGWYVGYDGSGCLTLVRNGDEVSLLIAHG